MITEALPDGRTLVEHDDGRIEVRGASTRPTERARMGYCSRPVRRAAVDRRSAEATAGELLVSLLDHRQRADRARRGRWWVPTPRGPVELGGSPHAMRFWPDAHPSEEWSLCAVPTDPTLPLGDVWSNLLLVLAVEPERFFAVANVHRKAVRRM
jgi:hypothetical protein